MRPASARDAIARVGAIVKGALHTRHLFLITVLTSAALAYLWGSSNWLPTYLREARGVLLVHVVDASDPEAIRARHARTHDRWRGR